MAKTDSLQGSLDLLVLKLLFRPPRLHGYAIMSAIRETSEEAKWIRAEWVNKENGRRARVYEITAAGKKQLAAEELRWETVTAAVNRVLRMA